MIWNAQDLSHYKDSKTDNSRSWFTPRIVYLSYNDTGRDGPCPIAIKQYRADLLTSGILRDLN